MRKKLYAILEQGETRAARAFSIGILALIFVNVAAVILETEPGLSAQIKNSLYVFEIVSVFVFTLEYILRIYVCVENPDFRGSVRGRLRYAWTPMAMMDLLAILPFYLPMLHTDLRFLRSLRLLRFFRLAKLVRYTRSLRLIGSVLKEKREELGITLFSVLIVLVLVSSIMYHIENPAQPQAFSSISAALWWGVATLTTVGYGDIIPITPLGKFFGAIIQLLGIGLFALPAGILSSGFADALKERKREKRCPHCGGKLV